MAGVTISLPEILATAAAVVAIGGGAAGLYRWSSNLYRQSVGSRQDHARRFNQLAAGVTTRYIEERFGAPAFVGDFAVPGAATMIPGGGPKLTEQVYHTRHAWLQIITDEHEVVVRFSVTVTDPRFHFQIRDLTFGNLEAKIGHNRFSEIKAHPEGTSLSIGAHTHEYSESYWFGNPGCYQHFVLSHNDAGTGSFGVAKILWFADGVLESGDQPPPEFPEQQWFRAQTVVNTLTVLGAGAMAQLAGSGETVGRADPAQWRRGLTALLGQPRGPWMDSVRVLAPDARSRRHQHRRIRRMRRKRRREIKHQEQQDAVEIEDQASS